MGKGNLFANLAQICILILVLPIIFAIIDADMLINFIQGIPIFDTWVGLLNSYANPSTADIVWIYTKSFFEAMILGICVHTTKGIGNLLQMKGLPILSTFLGLFVGSLLIKLLGVTQGFQMILYVAIMLVGILLMVKGVFTKLKIMSMESFLLLIIDSIVAVIMCGYVVALTLLSEGKISVAKLIFITLICVVALVISYAIDRTKKKEEKVNKVNKGGFIL